MNKIFSLGSYKKDSAEILVGWFVTEDIFITVTRQAPDKEA